MQVLSIRQAFEFGVDIISFCVFVDELHASINSCGRNVTLKFGLTSLNLYNVSMTEYIEVSRI